MSGRSWKRIWEDRRLDPSRPTLLGRLLAADGYDSGFATVSDEAWRAWVAAVGARLGVTPASSVFEVGCGAGAFLLPWHEAGCAVGGLDASATLVAIARAALPGAEIVHAEAAALPTEPRVDLVVSCGTFLYFPDLEYAREVLARMWRKARWGVAVLDVPDAERREAALAMRRGRMDPAAYEERYRGLDHLFYRREWLSESLGALGAGDVAIVDQDLADYPNGAFRFNVLAWRP